MKRLAYTLVLLIFVGFSCKPKQTEDPKTDFDEVAMLTALADNVIKPNYADFQSKVNDLHVAKEAFIVLVNQSNLDVLQDAFKATYKSWQKVSTFDFGPAFQQNARISINTFPTNTVSIEDNITAGSYNLGLVSSLEAKGLPALDYLLFHTDDASLITEFGNSNRVNYLSNLINDIKIITTEVVNAWDGSYYQEFITNTGANTGSSIADLVNQLSFDFELIKKAKVGVPSGALNLGIPQPEYVEAFYSGISKELITIGTQSILDIYTGGEIKGISNYIVYLGYNDIDQELKTKLNEALNSLNLLDNPLSTAVVNQTSTAQDAYSKFQSVTPLIKVELPNILGVEITYQDNDGD